MNSVVFLLIAGFVVVHANVEKHELAVVHTKNELGGSNFQPTIPSIVEVSTMKSSKATQLRLQSNKRSSFLNQDDKLHHLASSGYTSQEILSTVPSVTQHPRMKLEQSVFRSEEHLTPVVTASPHTVEPENFGPHQAQFYNGEQHLSGYPQFPTSRQGVPEQQTAFRNQHPEMIDQEFFDNRQSPIQPEFYSDKPQVPGQQQFFSDRSQAPEQQQFFGDRSQAPEQHQFFSDRSQAPEEQQLLSDVPSFMSGHQFSEDKHPSGQQQFYDNFEAGIGDHHIDDQRNFHDSFNQKDQIYGGQQPISFHPDEMKENVQLSSFDNQQQPARFPQSTGLGLSPVLIPGMNQFPVMPAMVNSVDPFVSLKTAGNDKGTYFQGKASIRQHVQTPFMRYTFSHHL